MTQLSPIRQIFNEMNLINDSRVIDKKPCIIDLTLGQPHLPVNPVLIEGLNDFLSSPKCSLQFGYSPGPGRLQTRKAITDLMSYYYPAINCNIINVMCTNGANQGLWNAFKSTLKPDDSAVVFSPYFSQYSLQIREMGAKLITIDTLKNNFRPNIISLEKSLLTNPEIKCLILNNPVNPSGVVWLEEELLKLADCLRKHKHIIIIQDEVYRDLSYSKFYSLLDIAPDLFHRIITIFSCAKALAGAPDLRAGMIFAHENLINKLIHQQMAVTAEVSLLSQVALTSILNAKLSGEIEHMIWENISKSAYKKNIDTICNAFSTGPIIIQNKPDAGFFVLLNCGALINKVVSDNILKKNNDFFPASYIIKTDMDIINLLMNCYDIACLPGSAFGIDSSYGFIRVSCATQINNIWFFIKQMNRLIFDLNVNGGYYA
ncbi:MAG: pyridoxal phosphate-dependent aminotransferase [Tatlockia sp.]|nr:pyridoxal phosphate-dependent aminotransferase [Tatlockia sp.]MBA3978036.1 pyridoxal phosphate-dependent aminotransferase [Nitrosopumilus sp.]